MKQLEWIKCGKHNWCDFFNVDLSHKHFTKLKGVYIIWHEGTKTQAAQVVRIGQGIIKDRIADHRTNKDIITYKKNGMKVTWAKTSNSEIDGIEHYLFDKLKPLVGERSPNVKEIEVNMPWN